MKIIQKLKNGLIVSCQALPDSPLYGSNFMAAMAKAAEIGGSVGIRANGPQDIALIKKTVKLPIIGINRIYSNSSEIYITPNFKAAKEIVDSGADIVALDATLRGRSKEELVEVTLKLKTELNVPLMADISTLEEGIEAERMGYDLIATTLSGYTSYSPYSKNPDIDLVKKLVRRVKVPVVAEGRIRNPHEAKEAILAGAFAVVVGGAITMPQFITKSFVEAISEK